MFREQLPAPGELLSHPLASCARILEVSKMHVARTSAETAEKRKSNIEDVQKRNTYRKAHGLETEDGQGLGVWKAPVEREVQGAVPDIDAATAMISTTPSANKSQASISPENSDDRLNAYADWEGRKRPVKKWLGIW